MTVFINVETNDSGVCNNNCRRDNVWVPSRRYTSTCT